VINLPQREDPNYKEVENFEDYELTQCIAYEMLIRNKDVCELINQYESYEIGFDERGDTYHPYKDLLQQKLLEKYFVGSEILNYILLIRQSNGFFKIQSDINRIESNDLDYIHTIEDISEQSAEECLVELKEFKNMLDNTIYRMVLSQEKYTEFNTDISRTQYYSNNIERGYAVTFNEANEM